MVFTYIQGYFLQEKKKKRRGKETKFFLKQNNKGAGGDAIALSPLPSRYLDILILPRVPWGNRDIDLLSPKE